MSDMKSVELCQTTDAVNGRGFGTNQLSENQGDYLKASNLEDGGDSAHGFKQPKAPQHQDV